MDVIGGQARMKKKGMTLLEVVLALAITGLFFCCLLDFTASGIRGHEEMLEEAKLRRQMSFIKLFVQDRVDAARGVAFYEEEGRLRRIVFYKVYGVDRTKEEQLFDNQKLEITNEKTAGNDLYKMTYESKLIASNIKEITFWQRDHWVYIRCTLVGKGGVSLTEDMILDVHYKH